MRILKQYIAPAFEFVAVRPSESYCEYVSIVGNQPGTGPEETFETEAGGYRGLWDEEEDKIFQ